MLTRQAVILCGGHDERLYPLTDSLPKPMALAAGRPFLWHLLGQLRDNGYQEVVLLTGYGGDLIADTFGDGAVVGIAPDTSVRTLSTPDNGEFINSTYPLTSTDYTSHMRFATGNETLYGIAVVSDGVQPMCINYKTGAAYPGFFAPLVQWLAGLEDLTHADEILETMLDSAQFRQKSDDDMTLVLAVRA